MVETLDGMGIITPADDRDYEIIAEAIEVASRTSFFRIVSGPDRTEHGAVTLDADISKPRLALGEADTSYRVRFVIPKGFPYRRAHAIPIEPGLKWYPHQDGDWADLLTFPNQICPPSLGDIYPEELLLPYIRHAHRWITDALADRLAPGDQHYELPHIVCEHEFDPLLVDGGETPRAWIEKTRLGRAFVSRFPRKDGRFVYWVRTLQALDKTANAFRSTFNGKALGREEHAGWAPWIYADNPVVGTPHRPPLSWSDLGDHRQELILHALHHISGLRRQFPFALLAFRVPKTWGAYRDRIAWLAIELKEYKASSFGEVPDGFRSELPEKWPASKRLGIANEHLSYRICTDVSGEALYGRAGTAGRPFDSLSVAIVGVGAVGSMLAKSLSRFGPRQMTVIDAEQLEPGNWVRHEGFPDQIGLSKAEAMAAHLEPLSSSKTVRHSTLNVTSGWGTVSDSITKADVVIDATGDWGVHLLLADKVVATSLIWCFVKPGPDFGTIVCRRPGSTRALSEADEALTESLPPELRGLYSRHADDSGELVWPSPGCYHPTFPAPFHRMRIMADSFADILSEWLQAKDKKDLLTIVRQAKVDGYMGIQTTIASQLAVD